MVRYTLRRLMALIPTLLAISAIVFFMGYLAPGDPVTLLAGEKASDEVVLAIKQKYGLDQPPLTQFLRFLKGAAVGDFGYSYVYQARTVTEMIQKSFWVSIKVGSLAMVTATFLGVTLGILAAVNRNKLLDHLCMLLAIIGVSIPNFVMAIALVWLFSIKVKLFPVAGWGQPINYVLPVIVLGSRSAAYIARLTRSSMLDVVGQDYIRTARAKGLADRVVYLKHAFKNTLIPVLTVLGATFGGLITGTYIIETLFNVPGMGQVAVQAIFQRDYPVIQATTLLVAVVFVLANLVVDLSYGMVDPRIKYN